MSFIKSLAAGLVAALALGLVAKRLSLSQGTVRNHLSSAIRKTGCTTSAEAVRQADENGWL